MIAALFSWIRRLFTGRTYSMAIVRRYRDANGAFVGELYLLGTFMGVLQYSQIGMSLDTLPLNVEQLDSVDLDTRHSFLDAIAEGVVRVGAQDPRDNESVQRHVRRLMTEGKISLQVQNRFVEWVMQSSGKGRA